MQATPITPQGTSASIYYATGLLTLHLGDCLEVLPGLAGSSIDAVVTDPPYGLEFMDQDWDAPWAADPGAGKTWDTGMRQPGFSDGASRQAWPSPEPRANVRCRRCQRWRVSSRPCRCPDPGFPDLHSANMRAYQDWCRQWSAECLRVLKPGGHLLAFGGTRTWHRLACAIEDTGFEIRDSIHWIHGQGFPKSLNVAKALGKAGRDALPARDWDGWGTALKPAHEPIIMARKPLASTVSANVTAYGTGALNIDRCRVEGTKTVPASPRRAPQGPAYGNLGNDPGDGSGWNPATGRWPPNLLLTHSPACEENGPCALSCPAAELDRQSGARTSGANPARRNPDVVRDAYGEFSGQRKCTPHRGADSGGASRFFPVFRYQPKASRAERPRLEDGTAHPTVKPVDLMRWLVRLVTPPGATVLDPFAGTGTTLHASQLEGIHAIGIERDPTYAELCARRLQTVARRADPAPAQDTGEEQ